MKAYTDLNQSKKLAEILPLESADMYYLYDEHMEMYDDYPRLITDTDELWNNDTPCWSLVALLDVIPQVKLDNIKQYNKIHWRCCAYFASDWHNSDWCNNPIDACYEMILKLHKLKML